MNYKYKRIVDDEDDYFVYDHEEDFLYEFEDDKDIFI